MAANIHDQSFSIVFGLLGNILSFFVYLAPLPTFYKIFKKKSTEGFQSIPYSVALFSAMLLLYYAFLKQHDAVMLITINSIGSGIESIYLIFYLIYATKTARIYTTKLVIFFNIVALGLIILVTLVFFKGHLRVSIVGWICAIFSVCVFAAPLSIITPNILGFSFGITQMILYLVYRGETKALVLPDSNNKVQLEQFPNANNVQQSTVNQNQEGAMNYGVAGMISNSQVVPSELNV
uniref:Bidirectional sugar transporter SWEET n=1 Tax=Gossypium raimondii TaxID=29730 RepID=A0A0D2MVJ4_GOSRA|nr:hypothetical protein B456_004G086000 [Gossypium raimondii]